MGLDVAGYAVSAGSACRSGAPGPSPALLGMGLSPTEARQALRLSFHGGHTDAAIRGVVQALVRLVAALAP